MNFIFQIEANSTLSSKTLKGPIPMKKLTRQAKFLTKTVTEFFEDDCTMMAAALAYYAVFSLPPLIFITILAAGAFWGEANIEESLSVELERIFGHDMTVQILDLMKNSQREGKGAWASLVSAGVLFIGSTGVMMQLQTALNRVWDTDPPLPRSGIRALIFKRVLSFAMVISGAILLLSSLVLTTVLAMTATYLDAYLPGEAISWLTYVGHLCGTLILIILMLAILFRWLPDARVHWKDVWVGATVTAVLFIIGKELMGWYLGSRNPSSYGTAGALVLLLMWIYYTSMIILFGAEFTQVWAQARGHRKRRLRKST